MYNFTSFGLQLNYNPDSLRPTLPPTDSRFRPDQLALENGQTELASSEKARLEEKQRAACRERTEPYEATYFREQIEPTSGDTIYLTTNDYWKTKETRSWPKKDLF